MMKIPRMTKLILISLECILVMVKPLLCETQNDIETITFTRRHLKIESLVNQGQRVRLDCSMIFGESDVKDVGYYWIVNQTLFSNEAKIVILANSDKEYDCTARGMAGEAGATVARGSIIITVTGPPYNVSINPMDRTVMISNKTTSVSFICEANKASYYYWLRGNDNLSPNVEFNGINNNSLILHNILPSDSGIYQCVAVNEHGKIYSNLAKLTIKVLPPVVTVEPELLETKNGEYAEFNCSAIGIGMEHFRYQWFLNKDLIPDQNTSTLVINNISQYDTGDYTCSVSNSLYGGIGRSGRARLTLNEYCHSVTVKYSGFSITWNETLIGDTVDAPCTGTGLNGAVHRRCMGDNQWDEHIECFREETKMLFDQAANLSLSVNELNEIDRAMKISSIVNRLANITVPTEEAIIFAMDINMAVKIISTLNSATETIIDVLNSSDTFFEDATSVVNNLLSETNKNNWQQLARNSSTSNQDLVKDAEQLTKLLSKTLNNDSSRVMKTKDNTVIKAEYISNDDTSEGYRFPDHHDDLTEFNGGAVQLSVPSSLLQTIKSSKITTTITIISNANNLRLPSPNYGNLTQVISSSTIFSLQMDPLPNSSNFMNEDDSIMITFNMRDQDGLSRLQDFTLDDVSCNFYDHALINNFNEFGGWSMEGVTVDKNNSNKTSVTCLTTHLTSFAVLVSIRDGRPSTGDKAISIISYIGCAISLICLCISIVILAYVLCKSKKNINLLFIHLNLCIALALGLAVFIAGVERATGNQITCKAVAVLLQYLFISAFCWMLCEGVMLYMMLVIVFGNKLNKKRFFFALGWGPAILIVAISAGLAHEQYGTDHYCWIKSNDGAIFAFIGPIASIILINFVFLAIALKVIAMDRQKLKRAKVGSNGDMLRGLMKASIVLLPLLGVTWIIGVFAVNDNTLVFAWIFAILNSLQGVFIFIFTVMRNKQVTAEIMKHHKYNARNKKISSNGSTNASQKRASQKTNSDTSIRHSRTLTGMGHFDSILERKRNWLRKSEIHSDSACKDNEVKLTAIRKKDLVIELCNVSRKDLKSDKIDSGGDKESKKSINIGEDNPATISVKPDLAVITAMPISTI